MLLCAGAGPIAFTRPCSRRARRAQRQAPRSDLGVNPLFMHRRPDRRHHGRPGDPCDLYQAADVAPGLSVPSGKDGSRLRAPGLLPVCAERFRRKRDVGKTEAVLMALWGFTHQPVTGAVARQLVRSGDASTLISVSQAGV